MLENDNRVLIEKLKELNHLEIVKVKILTAIFMKTNQEILNRKVQMLESSLKEQAKFYGQDLAEYQEIYQEILTKYKNQLMQIINQYNQLFINQQLELQEAECNQKIAITNFKKSFDIKKNVKANLISRYRNKMFVCMQKKENYDEIIQECERELSNCTEEVTKKINTLFSNRATSLILKRDGIFSKFLNKITNVFMGKSKFNTYCIEPIQIDLEMIEHKMPNILQEIREQTIHFVAKIKQTKEKANKKMSEVNL